MAIPYRIKWKFRSPTSLIQRLEVLDQWVDAWPFERGGVWGYRTSYGDLGYRKLETEAKEDGVFNLQMSLEEQLPETEAHLRHLQHLDEESWLERLIFVRGLRRKGPR